MQLIQSYFKGRGNINKERKDSLHYRVKSQADLINLIISHLDKYPLLTQKKADLILFKQVVNLISQKKHLTQEGLQQIVNIRAWLNLGLSSNLKAAFAANTIPVQRPLIKDQKVTDPKRLAGMLRTRKWFWLFFG